MRITLMLDGVPLFDSGARDMFPDAVKALAVAFCGLDSDAQARFFEEVGRIMASWEDPSSPTFVRYGAFDFQALEIGAHMHECRCVSDAGRELFRRIAFGLDSAQRPSVRREAPGGPR